MDEVVDPARAAIEEDLQSVAVLDGIENRYWRVVKVDFPLLLVAIAAGDGRELAMRIDVAGYPASAPAGTPWSVSDDRPLTGVELPCGPSAEVVFRSQWSLQNGLTPYMATERLIIQRDHREWAHNHPARAWNSTRTIAFYLAELHKELRSCTIPEVAA